MAIRIPARQPYDTFHDYKTQINEFRDSSPDMDAFRAILNSNIEPRHLERCILWYNSFDPTLHDRQAEWDVPVRHPRPELVIDAEERKKRKYDEETHEYLRQLAEKGNPPPKTQAALDASYIAHMKEHEPDKYEGYLKKVRERQSKRAWSFNPFKLFGKGGTRKMKRR